MPNPTIVKVVQTKKIEYADKAVNAAAYDLWDTAQEALNAGRLTFHLPLLTRW